MVRSGKTAKRKEPERPELVPLSFPRIVLTSMPQRIADKPPKGNLEDVARLLRVGTMIAMALKEQAGGQITVSAPLDSWHWLARQCAGFDTGAFGAQLSAKLAAIEAAPDLAKERREQAENDAALKLAADELRARESAEVGCG